MMETTGRAGLLSLLTFVRPYHFRGLLPDGIKLIIVSLL